MAGPNVHERVFIDKLKKEFSNTARSGLSFLNHPKDGWVMNIPAPGNYYCKRVMMCVPHKLFPGVSLCCSSPTCRGHLVPKQWHQHIRYIHGLRSGIFLVQYDYKCEKCGIIRPSADIVGDPNALLPDIVKLALGGEARLTFRSGINVDLRNFIINSAITRSTFDDLATAIKMGRNDEYLHKRTLYYSQIALYEANPEFLAKTNDWEPFSPLDDPLGYNEKPGLGEDYIRNTFVGMKSQLFTNFL
jgi:hypothetical protein